MGTVEQKDLDWIERAPVSFSGSATTTASPEAVFAILADHEHWPEWFPVIKKTEVLGPGREGVGMRRVATIPAGKIQELIIAWDPRERWAFSATRVSPGIMHALVEDCRIEPADSGTRVAPLRPIMKLMKGLMGKQLDKGMRALAARAEGRWTVSGEGAPVDLRRVWELRRWTVRRSARGSGDACGSRPPKKRGSTGRSARLITGRARPS